MRVLAPAVAVLIALASAAGVAARQGDPEPSADLLAGVSVRVDPSVVHRLRPRDAALAFLVHQPEATLVSVSLFADEAAACRAEPRLGCPVSHGRGRVWVVEATGRIAYCPRGGPNPCPAFAPFGFATILDRNRQIVGFGVAGSP
jgi:hypothetical protein